MSDRAAAPGCVPPSLRPLRRPEVIVDLAVRATTPSFDIVITGNASPAWGHAIDVDLHGLAHAGATWWLESLIHVDPLDLSLRVVDAGPPRP